MKSKGIILILTIYILLGSCLFAAAGNDVRGLTIQQEEVRIIDEKCLVCHNRKRIEKAVKARHDIDEVIRSMEKKGLQLTDKERQVIGHFWRQNPLKN
jgi:hypothetical protein